MLGLGIRCWPDKFAYVVLDGSRQNPRLKECDLKKFPVDLSRAGFLNWISKELKAILTRNTDLRGAGLKAIEQTAQKNNSLLRRAEVEGVLQAVLYESGCHDIRLFSKQQLKAALGYKGLAQSVTEALAGTQLRGVGNNCEEAALAAWAILEE